MSHPLVQPSASMPVMSPAVAESSVPAILRRMPPLDSIFSFGAGSIGTLAITILRRHRRCQSSPITVRLCPSQRCKKTLSGFGPPVAGRCGPIGRSTGSRSGHQAAPHPGGSRSQLGWRGGRRNGFRPSHEWDIDAARAGVIVRLES